MADNLAVRGQDPKDASRFAETYFDALTARSVDEGKSLTNEFIEGLTKRMAEKTKAFEVFQSKVKVSPKETKQSLQIEGKAEPVEIKIPEEVSLAKTIEEAGGSFVGMQRGFLRKNGTKVEGLVMRSEER